jgi:cob(I)alamin adenosyltransferase
MNPPDLKTDESWSGLLGDERLPKYDLRYEALGALDESNAALGLARTGCRLERSRSIIVRVQRQLYAVMSEIAATPENAEHFRKTGSVQVLELEGWITELGKNFKLPKDFILPGDSPAGAALDLARAIVRRAERRTVELLARGDVANPELVRYLNRLSSLIFSLELAENLAAGTTTPTLAKTD